MAENKEKVRNLVIDTNVIFASLIKEEGITRAALSMLSNQPSVKLFIPELFYKEVSRYSTEISRKAKIDFKIVDIDLKEILKYLIVADELDYKEYFKEAINLVNDENDTSFVALALKHRPSIIITYNKNDYKIIELEKFNIKVLTPTESIKEFGIDIRDVKTKIKRKKGLTKFISRITALFKK